MLRVFVCWMFLAIGFGCARSNGADSSTRPRAGGPADSIEAAYDDNDTSMRDLDLTVPPALSSTEMALGVLCDSEFSLTPIDTAISNWSLVSAPWGNESWGINAESFSNPANRAVGGARFVSWGHEGYVFLRENRGELAFARYVQGSVWGGNNFGAVPWGLFDPVAMEGASVRISFDVWNNGSRKIGTFDYWELLGLNVWFSSPNFPAGTDRNGRKPLVMDLVVANRHLPGLSGLSHFESGVAYHYQIALTRAEQGRWVHYDFELGPILQDAFNHFSFDADARRGVALYQAEFVLEARDLEASALVDNFQVTRTSTEP